MQPIFYAFDQSAKSWSVRALAEQQVLLSLPSVPTPHQRLIAVFAALRQRPQPIELAYAA